ncbi:uncharacterized protein N7500_000428 [Penicillium coprophilum]|uniref:uncharacterized protein n=1 Tax=Penicillium coprophilum TaxID=36646 RepID=UPI00239F253D|nr:uncharacterized protein N7500_000428 [Penicillium coprophilum]KAJ5177729.1 hypothetical protein N7500_000428 [Penicillium coprophilum]
MESIRNFQTRSNATTEPNTQEPVRPEAGRFAMLLPMNRIGRPDINAADSSGSEHHEKSIKEAVFDNKPTRYIGLSFLQMIRPLVSYVSMVINVRTG